MKRINKIGNKLFFLIYIFLTLDIQFSYGALDYGDGSDGPCTSSTLSISKRTYNCSTLTFDENYSFMGVGGAALIIKVLNDVEFQANYTFNISGANGTAGGDLNHPLDNDLTYLGSLGGPGGYNGGGANDIDGSSSIKFNPSDGSGFQNSYGKKGTSNYNNTTSLEKCGSGGGGGVSLFSDDTNNGLDSSSLSGGNSGETFKVDFYTDLLGGAGGGSGGGGYFENVGDNFTKGGCGGAGGGAIKIIASGVIRINGIIKITGGNGGSGQSSNTHEGGGGGGGAGGTLFLKSNKSIVINGEINISGGNGWRKNGESYFNIHCAGGNNGNGGDGGFGRIRFDVPGGRSGVTLASNSITPSAALNYIEYNDISNNETTFSSDLVSSCGTIALASDDDSNNNQRGPLIFTFTFLLGILISRYKSIQKLKAVKSHAKFTL